MAEDKDNSLSEQVQFFCLLQYPKLGFLTATPRSLDKVKAWNLSQSIAPSCQLQQSSKPVVRQGRTQRKLHQCLSYMNCAMGTRMEQFPSQNISPRL